MALDFGKRPYRMMRVLILANLAVAIIMANIFWQCGVALI
jgi:hypothetical protein